LGGQSARGAQFVGGVRGEPPLALHRRGNPRQQVVQAPHDGLELVGRSRYFQRIEMFGLAVVEFARQLPERSERPPYGP
jgi:hypothetical protein